MPIWANVMHIFKHISLRCGQVFVLIDGFLYVLERDEFTNEFVAV